MPYNLEYGAAGTMLGTGTSGPTNAGVGPYQLVMANTDCTFTANVNWKNASNPVTISLFAGDVRYGTFRNITVTSGSLLAYSVDEARA